MTEADIGWIAAIIAGGLAGWLAEMLMKSGTGILMNIILGIAGAALANWLLGLFGVTLGGWLGYLITGFVGAHASSSRSGKRSEVVRRSDRSLGQSTP